MRLTSLRLRLTQMLPLSLQRRFEKTYSDQELKALPWDLVWRLSDQQYSRWERVHSRQIGALETPTTPTNGNT
jgi:hypothetical protein